MKHKDEQTRLINTGRQQGLTEDQLYFLIALRKLEDGTINNEFNIKAVQNTSFEEQTLWAIASIKANEKRWQRYIKEQSYMDFPAFFVYLGGPYGNGWHNNTENGVAEKLTNLIKEIRDGFETNSGVG